MRSNIWFNDFVSVALLISMLSVVGAVDKLKNIDYLGRGYDAVVGNPHSDTYDPGFLFAIFNLTYNNLIVSSDGYWLLPDNVEALQVLSCSYDTTTSQIHDTTSYQNSLSVDAAIDVNFWFIQFSGSAGYKQVLSGTSASDKIYTESVAKCTSYQAALDMQHIQVASVFSEAVDALSEISSNDPTYANFIQNFGTHYVYSVMMGAKALMRSEFEQFSWTKMTQTGVDVNLSASLSFLSFFSGHVSVETQEEHSLRTAFETNRSTLSISYLGSPPSKDGSLETWMQNTSQSPYPVGYKLAPITNLINTQFLKNKNQTSLAVKRQLLNQAILQYCSNISGCGRAGPDKMPVKMNGINSTIIDQQLTTCRPGYSLLSCGMTNNPFAGSESTRYSYPSSSTSCQCNAVNSAVCIIWCTNAVRGFQIATSNSQQGTFAVNCPSGKQVIGCHILQSSSSQEAWRRYYPADNGTSCICYDYTGAQCVASCASNIYDYEIRKQFGYGDVTVQCSGGNFVLGCGLWPTWSGPDRFQAVFVASMASCQCHNAYGITCYAICGKFNTSSTG